MDDEGSGLFTLEQLLISLLLPFSNILAGHIVERKKNVQYQQKMRPF